MPARSLRLLIVALSLLPGVAGAAPEELLVGVLSEQHTRRCLGRPPGEEWIDPHDEVGLVRLVGPKGRPLAAASLRGQPVVARGRRPRSFQPPRVEHAGPCPEAQMRSDMVWSRRGFRLRRPGAAWERLPAFAVTRVDPFRGLVLARKGDTIEVRLENTLGRQLRDVVLIAHYEGCHGKPGTAQLRQRYPVLAPGASVQALFPARHLRGEASVPPDRREHFAFSVQVEAKAPGVHFDLDWRLADAGFAVTCTRGKRRK